jgi:hypothetical protein
MCEAFSLPICVNVDRKMILIHGCDRPSTCPLPVGDIGPNPHLNSRTISVDCQEQYMLDTVVIQKLNACLGCVRQVIIQTTLYLRL